MTSRTIRCELPAVTAEAVESAIASLPDASVNLHYDAVTYEVCELPQSWLDWLLRRPPQWQVAVTYKVKE
jgi:hypothetical protein